MIFKFMYIYITFNLYHIMIFEMLKIAPWVEPTISLDMNLIMEDDI